MDTKMIRIPMPTALAATMQADGHAAPAFTVPVRAVQALVDRAMELGDKHQIDPTTLALTLAAAAGYIALAEQEADRPVLLTSIGVCAAGAYELFEREAGGADLTAAVKPGPAARADDRRRRNGRLH